MSGETPLGMRLLPGQQAAVVAGVTLAVFAHTLSSGFVYDARMQILTDPFLHDPRNWWPVLTFRTLAMDVLDFQRPVNLASLMLDAAFWGREPFGYHLTSVLLHAANVLLVWLLLRRLTRPAFWGRFPSAAPMLGALLFAIHPLVTEAVCEPTFREDLLVAVFSLAALVVASGRPPAATGWGWLRAAAVSACCLLAIGSKESGIAAPLVLAVYWFLFRRREDGRFWAVAIGASTAVVAAFLVARFRLEVIPSAIFTVRPQYPGGSFAAAMTIQPRILALYVQLLLVPVNQSADYSWLSVAHLPLWPSVIILMAVAAAASWATWCDRRMGLALAVIVLPLVPVMNFVPIYLAAADRYLYLPLAGVGLAAGFLVDAPWLGGREKLRDGMLLALVVALPMLGMACVARQSVWASSVALWEDTHAKDPTTLRAVANLGGALLEAGRLTEAERFTREALRLTNGTRGDTWAMLAIILDAQDRGAEADAALSKALELDPGLRDPESRVAGLSMERDLATALGRLLARRPRP